MSAKIYNFLIIFKYGKSTKQIIIQATSFRSAAVRCIFENRIPEKSILSITRL